MGTAVVLPFPPEISESGAAVERYQDAYDVAEATTGLVETVKNGGIFLAGMVWIGALIVFQARPAERSGFPIVSALLVAGAVLLILISQILSIGLRVMAQLLAASIDSAVASSPFLSKAQRVEVMALLKPKAAVGWECARVRDLALLRHYAQSAPRPEASGKADVDRFKL